jgi:N utilization substance protein A
MNSDALLRMIDVIHRDKEIPTEVLFLALEESLALGVRKRIGAGEELVVKIDRSTGEMRIEDDEEEYELDMNQLGRIVAQSVKQGLQQRIREAERDRLFDDYETRVGSLVNGVVQRFEGDYLVVNLGRTEAYLSREDRVRGETFSPGDRIRALVIEVSKESTRVRILLSRTHPDLVRRLFALEVPEIADGVIEIKRVVREPGYRTKMAVISQDPKIDCIGACVGVRGSRIKAVIDELRGERIDIIRWSDSLETLILNGLKPATIHLDNIYPDLDRRAAVVIVDEDQQSLAIGKRGQNVRLASRLCGWDIDIKTRAELEGRGSSSEEDEAKDEEEAPADSLASPDETQEASTEEAPAPPTEADSIEEEPDADAEVDSNAETPASETETDTAAPDAPTPEAHAEH